jgi:hypothetical protein
MKIQTTLLILFASTGTAFLYSCGGPEATAAESGTDSTEIVEFELDEKRMSAVDFNNSLTLMFDAVTTAVDTLFRSDSAEVRQNADNALFEAEVNLSKIEALGSEANGAGDFKTAVFELLVFYHTEIGGAFRRDIIPILTSPKITKSQEKQLDTYDLDFAKREEELVRAVYAAQEKFTAANNIKLE